MPRRRFSPPPAPRSPRHGFPYRIPREQQARDPLEACPAAGEERTRHVLRLPPEDQEVELIVDHVREVDQTNRYPLSKTIGEGRGGWVDGARLSRREPPMATSRRASRLDPVDPEA